MKIDLLHNKIIRDTVTEAFCESFESNLVPKLEEKYGVSLTEIQMYEDCIADGLMKDGEFYYPLTAVVYGAPKREWIKWKVDKRNFEGGVPFAYCGGGTLEFEIAEEVPEEFSEKISERALYYEGGYVKLNVSTTAPDKTFLSGKYSQTFIDEMARQITRAIENTYSVSNLANSTAEITLVFAPATYMEHIVGKVTYRRLLISARGCSARDLWIKWYAENSDAPLTVSDTVGAGEIVFELGEDVPQKVREKEYRFLVTATPDKYQASMGRKNITEWRELIKRLIKRGELVKGEAKNVEETLFTAPKEEAAVIPEPAEVPTVAESEISLKLSEVLGAEFESSDKQEETASTEMDSELANLLKGVLGISTEEPEKEYAPEPEIPAFEEVAEEIIEEIIEKEPEMAEEEVFVPEKSEDELRREIERELRERLELEAKVKAEAERLELLRAHEELKAENERLAEMIARAEEEKQRKEAEQLAETEKLKSEIEARERAEALEKERMAEAARLALLDRERLEAEALERMRAREEEEKRRKAAEAEEARRLEEARRIEEERLRAEEEKKKAAEMAKPAYTYTSKNVRLLFRRPVDPGVTARIHEIILTTVKYFHKEDVYIKIKATIPDSTTVNLHFVKIPEEETELLINIIKVLGKSELGITKVYLE